MDELFTLHPNGLFIRSEAMDHGYNDRVLADARHSGVIARVRHGAYAPHDTWVNGDDIERHRLRSQAVLLTHGNRVALSHTSGAIEHGLRLWRPDLERVHVTRLDKGSGRQHGDVVYHEDTWTAADIYAKDELLVMGPETCALGAASLTTVECGIPILDSLFDLDLGSEESLVAAYKKRSHWPHSQRLQLTVRFARPGAQSIGESLARNVMRVQHLPEPSSSSRCTTITGTSSGSPTLPGPICACSESSTAGSSTAVCSRRAKSLAMPSSARRSVKTCCGRSPVS